MCEICRQEPCDSRCPNYTLQNVKYYCDSCGQGIYDGENYLENENGDKRHFDCFYGMRDLLEWLGYKIKVMETDDD